MALRCHARCVTTYPLPPIAHALPMQPMQPAWNRSGARQPVFCRRCMRCGAVRRVAPTRQQDTAWHTRSASSRASTRWPGWHPRSLSRRPEWSHADHFAGTRQLTHAAGNVACHRGSAWRCLGMCGDAPVLAAGDDAGPCRLPRQLLAGCGYAGLGGGSSCRLLGICRGGARSALRQRHSVGQLHLLSRHRCSGHSQQRRSASW